MAKSHIAKKGIDEQLSQKCMDIAFNSGNYNSLSDKPESHYIDQRGKVITEKDPYGI